jgi:autotransporter-associated beta strand protein
LTASDGVTSSGIDVLVEYSRAYNDGGMSGNNLLGSWFQADGSINGGGVARVAISGLAAGSYDLYTYGINGGFTGRGTRFIINNNNWNGGTPDGPSYNWLQTTGASASSFQNGDNYVVFNGAAPFGGSGFMEFYIGANPAGGNDQGPFNGFQLALLINDYWAPGVGGGGTGTWSAGVNNWAATAGTQGSGPQSSTSTLFFGDTAGTVTVSGGVSAAAGMTFSTDGYTLTGSTITLTGANAASNTITTAALVGATINSQLAGTNGMSKAGTGTLTLSGNNTYTGATVITAGTLLVNGDQSAATGAVSVAANATLGGNGTVGGATTFTGASIHAPGSAAGMTGTQTFSGTVAYGTGTIFEWDLNTLTGGDALDPGVVSDASTGSYDQVVKHRSDHRRQCDFQDSAVWGRFLCRCILGQRQELEQHLYRSRCASHIGCFVQRLRCIRWRWRDRDRRWTRPVHLQWLKCHSELERHSRAHHCIGRPSACCRTAASAPDGKLKARTPTLRTRITLGSFEFR